MAHNLDPPVPPPGRHRLSVELLPSPPGPGAGPGLDPVADLARSTDDASGHLLHELGLVVGVDGDALHGSAPIVPALPAAGVGGPAVARATVRSGVGEVVVTDRGGVGDWIRRRSPVQAHGAPPPDAAQASA